LHELATNAAKYGSLSAAGGRVEIAWSRTAEGQLSLRWIESGGPPVTPPSHRGFGTNIMENLIAGQLKGEVRFDRRDQGLMCEIVLERLAQEAKELRQRARQLPPCREREAVLRKARQDETAAQLSEWLTSPRLEAPR
jgi:hypothetical protein